MRIGPLAGAAALAAAAVWPRALPEEGSPEPGWKVTNVAAQAGLKAPTIYGGEKSNRYLVETTGCGVALIDYDGDGWLDIYQVNGSRFENLPAPQPRNHLYRNNKDGTFSDVTARAGVGQSRWGQAVAVGDFDGDGLPGPVVYDSRQNELCRNNRDHNFSAVTRIAGLV